MVEVSNPQQTEPIIEQERTVNVEPAQLEQQDASTRLASARIRLIEKIQSVRDDPDDTIYGGTLSKPDFIAALEGAIDSVQANIESTNDVEAHGPKTTPSGPEVIPTLPINTRPAFIRVGKAEIPICYPPRSRNQWKAFVSKMRVEGGGKWADVFFEKNYDFRPGEVVRPGEPLPFAGRKSERIQAIDNILEGVGEVRAFNKILERYSNLQLKYESLDPDAADYDDSAATLSGKMSEIANGSVRDILGASEFGIADITAFSARVNEIFTTQSYLRELDTGEDNRIPKIDANFKLTPFYTKTMERFAQLINRQLGVGNNDLLKELVENNQSPPWEQLQARGMTLVVGPKGTGKNKLAEHYAAITNRQLFRFTCSPHKTEFDLTYEISLKGGEIVKIPSRIIEGITTPNAMLELDEVNLLDPAVSKFLNSLLDHDRSLFLNNESIKVAPGVVIVGLMNPADYDGVKDLPETVDDRSNGMMITYPDLKQTDARGRENFTYDEALILKEHISPLQGFTDAAFINIWEHVINNKPYSGRIEPKIALIIRDLKNMITIFDRTRTVVKQTKTHSAGDMKLTREISLRGAADVVKFYSENHLWEQNIESMPGSRPLWNAAAYAVAAEYIMPRQGRYRRANEDRISMEKILSEQVIV